MKAEKKSQYERIKNALLAGQKLTTMSIMRKFNCTDGRKRLSEINKKYRLTKVKKQSKSGAYYTEYSIPI